METSLIEEQKKESYKIFDQIASTYDVLNHLLSGGMDFYWRHCLMKQIPPQKDLLALDLATGTGEVAIPLARKHQVKRVVGLDLSTSMLDAGRKKVKRRGLEHKCQLQKGDACRPPFPSNSLDLVTLAYGLRNFSHPQMALENIYKILKPGGRLLLTEFGLPQNWWIRNIHLFYLRHILPKVGRLLSSHPLAYTYLNQTIEHFPYGEALARQMERAGFQQVEARPMTFGITYLYIAHKQSEKT